MKKIICLCLSLIGIFLNTTNVFASLAPRMMITKDITVEVCKIYGTTLPDTYDYDKWEPALVAPGQTEYLKWKGTLYKDSGADYIVNNRLCNTYSGEVYANWDV